MSVEHLRPRTAPEVVDATFQLLRHHARPLMLLGTVVVLPGAALGLVSTLAVGRVFVMGDATNPFPRLQTGALLTMLPIMLVGTCWFFVSFGALVASASTAYVDGIAREPGDALAIARERAGVLLGSGILTYLLVGLQFLGLMLGVMMVSGFAFAILGFFLPVMKPTAGGGALAGGVAIVLGFVMIAAFIAGGAWLAGRYVTLPAVATNERHGVTETMRRARELSKASGRRITGMLVIVGVIFFVVQFGAVALLAALLGNPAAAAALTSVIQVPLYTFAAVLIAVLYYDLRVRHEGLDIELLAAELDSGAVAR